ncbi:MAG: hydantoinase B/oxoprolinase family protein, partial [Desulfarculaceae bacterium]
GNHLCPNNADAIMRALAPAIPGRVTAEWGELLCSLTTGKDPRKNAPYVDIFFMGMKGGSGGLEGVDGYDHIGMIDASGGVLDQDYEMFEQQTPHLLKRHEYWTDSAGPGHWRGGMGVVTEFVVGADDTQVVTFGDGDVEPSLGAHGGGEGTLNQIKLIYPDGKEHVLTTKDLVRGVPKDTHYYQEAGGGGGYGDPKLRPAEKVALEVRNQVISIEAARDHYGVALKPDLSVDQKKTAKLRG